MTHGSPTKITFSSRPSSRAALRGSPASPAQSPGTRNRAAMPDSPRRSSTSWVAHIPSRRIRESSGTSSTTWAVNGESSPEGRPRPGFCARSCSGDVPSPAASARTVSPGRPTIVQPAVGSTTAAILDIGAGVSEPPAAMCTTATSLLTGRPAASSSLSPARPTAGAASTPPSTTASITRRHPPARRTIVRSAMRACSPTTTATTAARGPSICPARSSASNQWPPSDPPAELVAAPAVGTPGAPTAAGSSSAAPIPITTASPPTRNLVRRCGSLRKVRVVRPMRMVEPCGCGRPHRLADDHQPARRSPGATTSRGRQARACDGSCPTRNLQPVSECPPIPSSPRRPGRASGRPFRYGRTARSR